MPPPAVRSSTPGWRDLRLWVGLAIVAGSVVAGSRVLAAADDTVQVWAVADEARPGDSITSDDLVARRLRFADDADLDRYFAVEGGFPDDVTVLRVLGEGELVPRAAVGPPSDDDTVTISLAVSRLLVPDAVAAGSVVNVYVAGDPSTSAVPGGSPPASERRAGEPVLTDVRVVGVSDGGDATGDRKVELAVPDADVEGYYALVGSLTTPVVSLAQVG